MERKTWKIVLSVLTLLIAFGLLGSKVHAQSVCYSWSLFPNERIRINIQPQGILSTGKETIAFSHANQFVFDASGKEVGTCGADTIAAIDGSIIVGKSKNPTTPKGAHMGLHSFGIRGTGTTESCFPVQFDCTSDETKADPDTWNCFSKNDVPTFHGASTLTKVDPKTDPLCSIFEDGAVVLTGVETQGPASGLKP